MAHRENFRKAGMAHTINDGHTRSLMIRALHDKGRWVGQRKGIHISLNLDPQLGLEDRRINWTAYTLGAYKQRVKGRAGTVAEALIEIERTVRNRKGD